MIEFWLVAAIMAAAAVFYLGHALMQTRLGLAPPGPMEKRMVWGIVVAVPALALLVYGQIGNPDLGDQPLATRPDKAVKVAFDDARSKMLAQGEVLQQKGGSIEQWQRFGEFAMALRDFDQAEIAARHLVMEQPENPEYIVLLIQTLMLGNRGQVTPEARKYLDELQKIAPNHPVAVEILRRRLR